MRSGAALKYPFSFSTASCFFGCIFFTVCAMSAHSYATKALSLGDRRMPGPMVEDSTIEWM